MEEWGIVVAFGGTMGALVTSFYALPQTERARYGRLFQAWVFIISIGIVMQLVGIISPIFSK